MRVYVYVYVCVLGGGGGMRGQEGGGGGGRGERMVLARWEVGLCRVWLGGSTDGSICQLEKGAYPRGYRLPSVHQLMVGPFCGQVKQIFTDIS